VLSTTTPPSLFSGEIRCGVVGISAVRDFAARSSTADSDSVFGRDSSGIAVGRGLAETAGPVTCFAATAVVCHNPCPQYSRG